MLVRSQSRQTLPSRRPLGQGYLMLRISILAGYADKNRSLMLLNSWAIREGKEASRVFTSRSKVF
ncbi:Uncharacterized protein APZ42_031580 [Daphnia magna]|uniref:Uncharacterized protein n=1 Tax=Daphnia magna TaxID=35525 RepID=A0A0P5T156_9CRUS|nr:Uncharacterized protein APZ42_031580 [Daphnia magna]